MIWQLCYKRHLSNYSCKIHIYEYFLFNQEANTINNELQKRNTCFAVNKLLNTNKTRFILFSNRYYSLPGTVKINNIEIDRLYYSKFLGVIIDHRLNWKGHIDFIGKKVSITIIRKAKHFVNCDDLLTL